MGGSGSKAEWSPVDMNGKTVIVTGANSGIGFETAKFIAMMGAKVIIACRSENKAKAAMLRMEADYIETQPDPTHTEDSSDTSQQDYVPDSASVSDMPEQASLNIEFMRLDLNSLKSVESFAEAFKEKGYPLHVLVCNGGIMAIPQEKSEDGFEKQFQVNYLSHFLLILHMIPIMRHSGEDCRIVNVSSMAHDAGKFDIENIQGQKRYNRADFYGNSKLYQIMMMYSLERRLQDTHISTYSLHPGVISTNIVANIQDDGFYRRGFNLLKAVGYMTSDIKRGAATSILLSVAPHIKELRGYYFSEGVPATPSKTSRKFENQEVLWRYTLECLDNFIKPGMLSGLNLSHDDQHQIDSIIDKYKTKK